jgi:hypothetical protein
VVLVDHGNAETEIVRPVEELYRPHSSYLAVRRTGTICSGKRDGVTPCEAVTFGLRITGWISVCGTAMPSIIKKSGRIKGNNTDAFISVFSNPAKTGANMQYTT